MLNNEHVLYDKRKCVIWMRSLLLALGVLLSRFTSALHDSRSPQRGLDVRDLDDLLLDHRHIAVHHLCGSTSEGRHTGVTTSLARHPAFAPGSRRPWSPSPRPPRPATRRDLSRAGASSHPSRPAGLQQRSRRRRAVLDAKRRSHQMHMTV